jgi:hypothetical protein
MTLTSTPEDYARRSLSQKVNRVWRKAAYTDQTPACGLTLNDSTVNELLQVSLQPLSKVVEHGRPAGEDNVLQTRSGPNEEGERSKRPTL